MAPYGAPVEADALTAYNKTQLAVTTIRGYRTVSYTLNWRSAMGATDGNARQSLRISCM